MDREARHAVAPVVAVILLVAITVVLAASVYFLATSLVVRSESGAPFVSMLRLDIIVPGETRIKVAGVSATQPLTAYEVVLLRNVTVDAASGMNPLTAGTVGNVTFLDGDGSLNAGDMFVIKVTPGSDYDLILLWRQTGNQVGTVSWFT